MQNLRHSRSPASPGGGTVTSVTASAPTPRDHRRAIGVAAWWRQNRRAGPGCFGSPWRTAATKSAQEPASPFLTLSCHIEGMVRPRSRTVTTTSTEAGAREATIRRMPAGVVVARNSIDTTAVPGQAAISVRNRSQAPTASAGTSPSRRWPRTSMTAATWCRQVGPGNRKP